MSMNFSAFSESGAHTHGPELGGCRLQPLEQAWCEGNDDGKASLEIRGVVD